MAHAESNLWLKLNVGDKVYYRGQAYQVQKVLNLDEIWLQDLQTNVSLVAPIKDLSPDSVAIKKILAETPLSEISEEDWAKAKKRQAVLDKLFEKNPCLSQDITKAAQELGVTKRHIYNLLKEYQQSGFQLRVLLPANHTGGRGKSRLAAETEAIIAQVIQEIYLNEQRFSASWVILEIKKRCQKANIEFPSEYAIRARLNQLPMNEVLKQRYGATEARKTLPILGHFPETAYPLAVLQIDHTRVDVIVVDQYLRKPIGRPYLTVAIDVYSRCITGFCLTLEAPSALSVGLCLTHSVFDKEEWLALRKIETNWPIWGKPDAIYVDNAKEFHSEALQRGCDFHGIKLQFRPLGMPHYGGIVERVIGTLMELIHQIPGTTFSNVQEKAGYDSEGKAALTLAELEKWLTIAISDYYHQKCHRGIEMAPLEKYKMGILGDPVIKGRGYPVRIYDKKVFLIDFLPIKRRHLQRVGFVLEHITYYSNALAPWVAKRKSLGKFVVRQDPRNLSSIFVLDPELEQYLEIPCRNLSRPMITLWEHREAIKQLREQSQEINETLIFRAIEMMRTVTQEAVAKSRLARRKYQRLVHREDTIAAVQDKTVGESVTEEKEILPFEDIEIWETPR